jgi:hypothetical protein
MSAVVGYNLSGRLTYIERDYVRGVSVFAERNYFS